MTIRPVVLCLSLVSLLSLGTPVLRAASRLVLTSSSIGPIVTKAGANGANQTVNVYNAGTGTLNLTAAASNTWLSASVGSLTSCSANSTGCYPVTISLNTSSLAIGTYTEYITLTDPDAVDSPEQIAVTVNVQGVPSSLSLYVTPTGGLQPNEQVGVTPAGSGFTSSVTTSTGGSWLSFVPTNSFFSSIPPYTVVGAVQSGQATGTYTGSITISGSSASSDNKTIPVTLTVTTAPIVALANISPLFLNANAGATANGSFSLDNIGSGVVSITAASSSASYLTATASGNTVNVTADAASLSPGIYHATITTTSNAANNGLISVPVELTVASATTPAISQNGIVSNADYTINVAPGALVSMFGNGFAPTGTRQNSPAVPLSTSLSGVSVLVNGNPAPLLYVSPTQINFQMPYEAAAGALATVQVNNNSANSNTRSILVSSVAPRIFTYNGDLGVILNNNTGVIISTAAPATAGETLQIYCSGLGQTAPAGITGAAPNGFPNLQVTATAQVTIGPQFNSQTVQAVYTGLAPGYVGLYQVNVTLPAGVATGSSVPINLVLNGVSSNVATIAIQ